MEAENGMQNGWEEFDPADNVSEPAPEAVVITEDAPPAEPVSVNELQPRRRGRRPREATE